MSPSAHKDLSTRDASALPMTICILDDEPGVVGMLKETLESLGFTSFGTSNPQEALEEVGSGRCRVVLSDIRMPSMDGLIFLQQALLRDPGVYVILMTGSYSLESAIEAIKHGAYDYLPKPVDRTRLKRTLDDVAEVFQRRRHIRELDQQLLGDLEFHGIVGRSPVLFDVFDLTRKIARHYTNVLVTGPTGTGKELIARAIHKM